jgi:hypothetical protein
VCVSAGRQGHQTRRQSGGIGSDFMNHESLSNDHAPQSVKSSPSRSQ